MPTTNYTSLIQQAITQYSNDGVGLYNAIKSIHTQAQMAGDSIVYPAGQTLNITVCLDNYNNAQEIPLPKNTHFMGCTFNVTNPTTKEFFLFSLKANTSPTVVSIPGGLLRKNNIEIYGPNHELDSTPKLIIVEDQNQWTARTEYNENNELVTTPFYRKDVLYMDDNLIQNDPISSYASPQSSPLCKYINVSPEQKTFKSIVFNRTASSVSLTNLILIKNQYNVLLDNVAITTPEQAPDNGIYHDCCINILDSAKISLSSITFNHTYSAIYHWGYGICMGNVWKCSISGLTAINPAKGVMGNENINELTVENSSLNRVDVHCYGRDITCTNCTFKNITNTFHVYNRASSFFGKLIYTNCSFYQFLPLRLDEAYNAFTSFDLVLDNCSIYVGSQTHCLMNIGTLDNTTNSRIELQLKCLPNIIVKNLHLIFPLNVTSYQFIYIDNFSYIFRLGGMDTFLVDVIEVTREGSSPITFSDSNVPINLFEPLRRNLDMNRNLAGS